MTNTTHSITSEIAQIVTLTPQLLVAQMQRAASLLNTPDKQQEILDAMPDFGITAKQAIEMYGAFYELLSDLGMAQGINPPDPEVFQVQEDGSVIYVAPPAPPAPEPEPEPLPEPLPEPIVEPEPDLNEPTE
jgi:outer membrane biosynthesis protein TonB